MTTLKNAAIGALFALFLFGAYGLVDRIERDTEDRLSYRAWVADACIPKPGETAIAVHEDKKLHCTIYSRIGYGLVPVVASAAVMESPL
jgi:hypothetical protein